MACPLAHLPKHSLPCPGTPGSWPLTFPVVLPSPPLASPVVGLFSPQHANLPASFWQVTWGYRGHDGATSHSLSGKGQSIA